MFFSNSFFASMIIIIANLLSVKCNRNCYENKHFCKSDCYSQCHLINDLCWECVSNVEIWNSLIPIVIIFFAFVVVCSTGLCCLFMRMAAPKVKFIYSPNQPQTISETTQQRQFQLLLPYQTGTKNFYPKLALSVNSQPTSENI